MSSRGAPGDLADLRARLEQLHERASGEGAARSPVVKEALGALEEAIRALATSIEDLACAKDEVDQANAEAVEQARRYADLFRLAPDAYVVTDERGVVLEMNDLAEHKFGRIGRLMVGKPLMVLVAQTDREAFLEYLESVRERRSPGRDQVVRFSCGTEFDASLSASARVRDDRFEIRWILRDVTEERRTERALRAEAARMNKALDVAFDGLLGTDAAGMIRSSNVALSRMFGYEKGDLEGRAVDVLGFSREALAAIETETIQEWIGVRQDGSRFPIQVSTEKLSARASLGTDRELVTGVRDLSAERGLESKLRAATAATAMAEERERQRLAADLHDDVGQLLSLAAMKLGMLRHASGDRVARLHDELTDLVSRAHQRTESLMFQLSPPILRDMGLAPAIEWLAEDIARTYGLRVHVEHDGEPPLDEATRLMVFRALRELLINAARHARASAASVVMRLRDARLEIAVEDRGVGFDLAVTSPGFGLMSVRERLESLGGQFTIESHVGAGTRAQIVVALPPPEEDEEPRKRVSSSGRARPRAS